MMASTIFEDNYHLGHDAPKLESIRFLAKAAASLVGVVAEDFGDTLDVEYEARAVLNGRLRAFETLANSQGSDFANATVLQRYIICMDNLGTPLDRAQRIAREHNQ